MSDSSSDFESERSLETDFLAKPAFGKAWLAGRDESRTWVLQVGGEVQIFDLEPDVEVPYRGPYEIASNLSDVAAAPLRVEARATRARCKGAPGQIRMRGRR